MSITSEKALDYKIDQLGIVVEDMDETSTFLEKLGIGPFPTVETSTPSGKIKIGIFQQGDLQIELIQPLEGNTPQAKFLKERGEGLHHVSNHVEDIEKELQKIRDLEIEIIERGEIMGVKYAYLDTEKYCGFVLELAQWPEELR